MKIVFESQFTNLLFLLNGLVLLMFFYYRRKKKNRAMKFGNFETLRKVAGESFLRTDDLMLVTKFLAITFLIIGISSPVLVQEEKVARSDYAILLDSSGSMFTSDIQPSRFGAAKEASKSFIRSLPNETEVGLVTYSGEVGNVTELTSSHDYVLDRLSSADLGDVAGTAIGNAVSSGVSVLEDSERRKRIILLTDGTNNMGISLDDAAEKASNQNVSIFAIGIGEKGNESAEYGLLEGRNVSKATSPNLNPGKLRTLAERTGGNVSIATDSEEIGQAFIKVRKERVRTDFSRFFVLFSAFLLVIDWALKSTDLEVLP